MTKRLGAQRGGKTVAQVALANQTQVADAVAAAEEAFRGAAIKPGA